METSPQVIGVTTASATGHIVVPSPAAPSRGPMVAVQKEAPMQDRKFSVAPVVIVAAAVLGLAELMFVTVGIAETLVLLALVAMLSGMYGLRHYARARLIYRRSPEPAGSAPADPS
jgi:hypothetical protein